MQKSGQYGEIFLPSYPAHCCSVTQSCLTLCRPIDCSMPGLPVPHHHPKFAQVQVHCISDVIQPSHPLTPSSPSALNLSQHPAHNHLHLKAWSVQKVPLRYSALAPAFCTWKPNCLWSTFSLSLSSLHPQGIFLTQGSNLALLHCRQILYSLSHQGISVFLSDYWSFARVLHVLKIVALCLFYILSLSV